MYRPETIPKNELTDWVPVPAGYLEKMLSARAAPYESSLIGEYARLLLLVFVVPLVIWFANFALNHESGILGLIAGLVLLVTLITSRGNPLFRVVLLATMAANVFASVVNSYEPLGTNAQKLPEGLIVALLVGLGIASCFELVAWTRSCTRTALLRNLAWGLVLVPALIYVLGIPILDSIWMLAEGDEKKVAMRDPNWKLSNETAFRAAKLAVFSLFVYLGACLGSFLNVVAYCVPRGQGIGLRDSKCPLCETPISRIDNLPIFSYVNLGGKCRSCYEPISARYLIVEIVAAAIFGSLFLYELVTGCENIPHLRISHEGILWVILYPKWPAIGSYIFHALFMCALLVLALMEWDEQPLKPGFALFIGLVFFVSAATYLPLQPVPLFEHVPEFSIQMSPWKEQVVKLVVGGALGAVLGRLLGFFSYAKYPSVLVFAFSLTGMVLGWQALMHIALLFLIAGIVVWVMPNLKTHCLGRPTTLLLAAVVIHHPFWKIIAQWWGAAP